MTSSCPTSLHRCGLGEAIKHTFCCTLWHYDLQCAVLDKSVILFRKLVSCSFASSVGCACNHMCFKAAATLHDVDYRLPVCTRTREVITGWAGSGGLIPIMCSCVQAGALASGLIPVMCCCAAG